MIIATVSFLGCAFTWFIVFQNVRVCVCVCVCMHVCARACVYAYVCACLSTPKVIIPQGYHYIHMILILHNQLNTFYIFGNVVKRIY